MGKIALEDKQNKGSQYYSLATEARHAFNETNDCTVIAVAAACGVTYAAAHAALKVHGRVDGRGASYGKMRKAIADLGCKIELMIPKTFILRYPPSHAAALKNVTTHHPARFNAAWRDGNNYILCLKSAHVAAVLNGAIQDWSAGRALQVSKIWRIVR